MREETILGSPDAAAAATRIQSRFRGIRARKSFVEKRSAVAVIQRAARSFAARRSQAKAEEENATRIQATFRGHIARKVATNIKSAISALQGAALGHLCRKTVADAGEARRHAAATLIQAAQRGRMARNEARRRASACVTLQAAMRGHLARKRSAEAAAARAHREAFFSGIRDRLRRFKGLDEVGDEDILHWATCRIQAAFRCGSMPVCIAQSFWPSLAAPTSLRVPGRDLRGNIIMLVISSRLHRLFIHFLGLSDMESGCRGLLSRLPHSKRSSMRCSAHHVSLNFLRTPVTPFHTPQPRRRGSRERRRIRAEREQRRAARARGLQEKQLAWEQRYGSSAIEAVAAWGMLRALDVAGAAPDSEDEESALSDSSSSSGRAAGSSSESEAGPDVAAGAGPLRGVDGTTTAAGVELDAELPVER